MNTLRKILITAAGISLLISACGGHTVQTEPAEAAAVEMVSYQVVLGELVNDAAVKNFIVTNNCSPAADFHLCKDTGMAFWSDADQIVKTVYLYSGNVVDFRRYRGELPYGLTFYDPMWRVEEKLGSLNDDGTLQPAWQAGLPDEAGSPDHMHYWTVYKHLGMTVIYNSPGRDEDAYIYAILMSQ